MNRKMFTLSFDDKTIQDRRLIELLDKYNLRATFNIDSGSFGNKHEINHIGIVVCHDDIEAAEVNELYRNHEVACHTVHHPNLKNCDDEKVLAEVNENHETLEALSGKNVFGLAYPCGGDCYDERVIKLLTDNTAIKYARTTKSHHTFDLPENFMEWHPTCHQNDDDIMDLAEKFISAVPEEDDMLFYLWGHSFEFDKFNSWDMFEQFCEKISMHRDITYMTNGEVYKYLTKKREEKAEK